MTHGKLEIVFGCSEKKKIQNTYYCIDLQTVPVVSNFFFQVKLFHNIHLGLTLRY